jgi:hypothetical protein
MDKYTSDMLNALAIIEKSLSFASTRDKITHEQYEFAKEFIKKLKESEIDRI